MKRQVARPNGGEGFRSVVGGSKKEMKMRSEEERNFLNWGKKESLVHDCLRHRGLLYQIAERVLDGPEGAEEAVNRSLTAATRRTYDNSKLAGEFRGWLLRIVIDEALLILRGRDNAGKLAPEPELVAPLIY